MVVAVGFIFVGLFERLRLIFLLLFDEVVVVVDEEDDDDDDDDERLRFRGDRDDWLEEDDDDDEERLCFRSLYDRLRSGELDLERLRRSLE